MDVKRDESFYTSVIESLQSNGSFTNLSASDKKQAMIMAVEKGDVRSVKLLLKHGVDVKSIYYKKRNCLYHAVFQGHLELVKIFVNYVNINEGIPGLGFAPLEVALTCGKYWSRAYVYNHEYRALIFNKYIPIVHILLVHGADPNVADEILTLLHQACMNYFNTMDDTSVVRLLVTRGADITVLCNGAYASLHRSVYVGNMKIVKYLAKQAFAIKDKQPNIVKNFLVEAFYGKWDDIIDFILDRETDRDLRFFSSEFLREMEQTVNDNEMDFAEVLMLMVEKDMELELVEVPGELSPTVQLTKRFQFELSRMKSTTVCEDSTTTYFDVLTKRGEALVNCLRNESVIEILQSGCYKDDFVHYGARLNDNYLRGCVRMRKLDTLYGLLSEISENVLPRSLIIYMGRYFDDAALEQL